MSILSSLRFKLMPMADYPEYLRRKGVTIGIGCEIYKSASFGSEPYLIDIGNHVRINSNVQFITHDGGCWVLRDPKSGYGESFKYADCFGKIVVGDNVHIGNNAIIMPGVTIGSNVIIAAGAIVTHDVPDGSIWGGIPAKKIETLEEYANKMKDKFVDTKNMTLSEKKIYLLKMFNK